MVSSHTIAKRISSILHTFYQVSTLKCLRNHIRATDPHLSNGQAMNQAFRAPKNMMLGTIPKSAIPASSLDCPSKSSPLSTNLNDTQILRQPETKPISQDQLVVEVKGIYVGLVMVEGKCIQVDAKQAQLAWDMSDGDVPKLTNDQ